MHISVIGPTGAGKGTQVEKLAVKFGFQPISTGELFKEHIRMETELGQMAKDALDHGELVPDEVVNAMIEESIEMTNADVGLIFDGFPRTTYQARFMDDLFRRDGRYLGAVIYLRSTEAAVVARLSERRVCRVCLNSFHNLDAPFTECPYNKCAGEHLYQRDYDHPDRVRARLKVFERFIGPLLEYYATAGKLSQVNGDNPADQVFRETSAIVEQTLGRDTRR